MYKFFYGTLFFIVPLSITYAESHLYNSLPEIPEVTQSLNEIDTSIQNKNISLYLLVFINQTNTSQIIEFFESEDKTLYTTSENLRKLRFKPDDKNQKNQFIRLNDIAQLEYDYRIENQEIHITIPQDKLNSYVIDLKTPQITNEELANFKPLNSTLINYSVYNTFNDQKNHFAASLEGRISTQYGNISHNVIYRDRDSFSHKAESLVRLDSFWQYIDPVKIRSYTLGDFISHTPEWGNSVRLSGFQWSSAYQKRADIITAALPQFSGSASLPSTLDLFINQQRIYSGEVPSGPFDVKSLPYISGNEVTLLTKDATGQQNKTTQQYYYSQNILSKGIQQFSIDIGIPRQNFGLSSDDYDSDVVFGSASFRKGLNNHLTLDSNIELSSDGLTQVGMGLTTSIFNRGILSLAGAESQYKALSGSLFLIGVEGRLHQNFSVNSKYQKTFDQYTNLSRVADLRYREKTKAKNFSTDNTIYNSASAKEILQFGFSLKLNRGFNVSGNYYDLKNNNEQYRNASISFGGRIRKNLSFYGTSYKDLSHTDNYGFYFSLIHTPSSKMSVNASYSKNSTDASYRLQLNSTNSQAIGDFGWGVSLEQNNKNSNEQHIYLNYLARPAFLSVDYTQSGAYQQTVISATGALLAASGRVFATNQIGDSFAIIDQAGPHSYIKNGGVNLGKSDAKGRFLISNLTPYSKHTIYLDPTHLPLDWIPETTEKSLITGYHQGTHMSFQTRKSISTTVILIDKNRNPIAPGYQVKVNENPETAITGYAGETYILDLKPHNKLTVDLLDEGKCHIEFDYSSDQASIHKIGPYICQ